MNNLDKNVTGKETFYFIQYEDVVRDYSLMDKTGFDLFSKYEGCIIENGLFKFHTKGSSYIWTKYTSAFFKDYLNKIFCFGFDWMGRQFAVDLKIEMIYIFDSATGGAYQLDESLKDFLEKDLTIYREETFNIDFFDELYKIYKTEWVFSKCFGFSIPLFLNGKDEINNYECIDMEVYWDTNYQLLNKINNLPGGTLIDSVNVD
ncbi:MAG: hypothetical protein ACTHJ0_08000 [Flavipsychrobacter sp.]